MSDAYPDVRPWTFPLKPRQGVKPRTYEQRELSIDGEMQLFGLVARTTDRLRASKFPFDKLGEAFPFDNDGNVALNNLNWGVVAALLSSVAQVAPAAIGEAAALLLGIFPTDENGSRNKDWEPEVSFLRANMHVADLVEMLEVGAAQNDIDRLLSPFARARELLSRFSEPPKGPEPEPSPEA